MDYSQITDDLYLGTTPGPGGYELLRKLGIRLVLNMRFLRGRAPAVGNPPMAYLRLRTIDSPLFPIPIAALMRGAQTADQVLRSGGKVYVHCSRGRHRGVAMAAAVLIARGLSAEVAIRMIKDKRAQADPDAGYIRRRILLFEQGWRARASQGEGADEAEGMASLRHG